MGALPSIVSSVIGGAQHAVPLFDVGGGVSMKRGATAEAMGIRNTEKEDIMSAAQERRILGTLYMKTSPIRTVPHPEYCARRVIVLVIR
jgi:hypothetical protein